MIALSFFIAFILTVIPVPEWLAWMRPAWVLMVVIYWIVVLPHRLGIGVAWLCGLFLDVLNGTILGEHALAMTVPAFIAVHLRRRFRMFPLLQQGMGILLMVFLYQLIIFCVQGFLFVPPAKWLFWLVPVTSMLLWPLVFGIMRDAQHRMSHSRAE